MYSCRRTIPVNIMAIMRIMRNILILFSLFFCIFIFFFFFLSSTLPVSKSSSHLMWVICSLLLLWFIYLFFFFFVFFCNNKMKCKFYACAIQALFLLESCYMWWHVKFVERPKLLLLIFHRDFIDIDNLIGADVEFPL